MAIELDGDTQLKVDYLQLKRGDLRQKISVIHYSSHLHLIFDSFDSLCSCIINLINNGDARDIPRIIKLIKMAENLLHEIEDMYKIYVLEEYERECKEEERRKKEEKKVEPVDWIPDRGRSRGR